MGSAIMNMPASSSLILTAFSSFERLTEVERRYSHGALYQEIAQTLISNFHVRPALKDLAARLARVADHAHSIHQFDIVADIGQFLLTLPLSRQLQSVGYYYQALSLGRGTPEDIARALSLFEHVAEGASSKYRARAILALGSKSMRIGDRQTAMSFYRDVTRVLARDRVLDPMTLYGVNRMTAVVKATEGDHRGALADLEKMVPLVRLASLRQPYAYYDYLNTLAVELCEAGRLEEARRASEIALASPFARAYPEWSETFEEIEIKGRRASRSTVALARGSPESENVALARRPPERENVTLARRSPDSDNLIRLPRPSGASTASGLVSKSRSLARVLKFPQQAERNTGLSPGEKCRIVSNKLYDLWMSLIRDDGPVNPTLVEELYRLFFETRKQG